MSVHTRPYTDEPTVTIFTKPDCPHCAGAKAALEECSVSYREIDVAASVRNANASVYASGSTGVPQAFAGDTYLGDGASIVRLHEAGALSGVVRSSGGWLDLATIDDDRLAGGATDVSLRDHVPEIDPTATDDPEQWPIMRHFKETFGFLPNSGYYQARWPEAYKLFSHSHYFDTEEMGFRVMGKAPMLAAAWATSDAHGCNYCRVHTTNMGSNEGSIAHAVQAAREGTFDPEGPIGPFELALAELAAASTTNLVTDAHFGEIERAHGEARISDASVGANVEAVGMVAAAFGFLNVFNDIVNIPIEREWAAQSKENAEIDAGRHGTSEDRASDNLDGDLPGGGPSAERLMAKYDRIVDHAGGVDAFCRHEFGFVPNWIEAWPEAARKRHALFYAEVMGERVHSVLPREIKHLMARVSAIEHGHDYFAAAEGALAMRAGGADDRTTRRARWCHAASVARTGGRSPLHEAFDEKERALLSFARLSATTPLATPERFVRSLLDLTTPRELIEASFVVAAASMIQRFAAIARLRIETEVATMHERHGLPLGAIAGRFPDLDDLSLREAA